MNLNINSLSDSENHINNFICLSDEEKQNIIEYWIKKIESNKYNNFEWITFLKICDVMNIDTSDDIIEEMSILSEADSEMEKLIDNLLERYSGTKKQKSLLDEMINSKTELETLQNYYKQKITN